MREYSSSENYKRIMDMDCGRLFLTAVALESLLLMTPVDINDIFEREKLKIDTAEQEQQEQASRAQSASRSGSGSGSCDNFRLVKRYMELDSSWKQY